MKNQTKSLTWSVLSKYRSLLMGLGTLSVVFFHYTVDCRSKNINYSGFIKLFNQYISGSGVELFLVLSGIGLYYAWKKNNNYRTFISKRFNRIFIPYLLIAIPAYVIRDVCILDKGFLTAIKGITFYNFIKSGGTWHWYVFMIAICYLIFPWLYDIVEEYKSKIQSYTILLGAFTVTTVIAILLQKNYSLAFENLNIMILRFPSFVLGVFLGRACYEKRKIGNDWIIFGILCLICIPLRSTGKIILVRYLTGAIGLFVCFVAVKIFNWIDERNINLHFVYSVIEWFGKYSLEIYLTHVTVRTIMIRLGYHPCYFKYFLIEIAISIVWSIIAKKVTDYLLKRFASPKKELPAQA